MGRSREPVVKAIAVVQKTDDVTWPRVGEKRGGSDKQIDNLEISGCRGERTQNVIQMQVCVPSEARQC